MNVIAVMRAWYQTSSDYNAEARTETREFSEEDDSISSVAEWVRAIRKRSLGSGDVVLSIEEAKP